MSPLTAASTPSLPQEPNRLPGEDYPGGGSMAVVLPSQSGMASQQAAPFESSSEEVAYRSLTSPIDTPLVPVARSEWIDSGYRYQVSAEAAGELVVVNVSRILAQGRGSPLAGRRVFPADRQGGIVVILETDSPARTRLADQIIQGGSVTLDSLLASVVQPEFWMPLL